MTRKNNSKIISVVHRICCGLDVDKDMVSAGIIITGAEGEETFVVKEFSTFTDDLYRLKAWLLRHACKVIAIERDINMIGQPSAQQIVGLDPVNETTIPQG